MKKDMDLIRLILLEIEKDESGEPIYDLEIDGYDMKQVAYHCKLLWEHGFVDDYSALNGDEEIVDFAVGSLTWEGHEYLDKVRDRSVWNKVKAITKEKGLPLTISVVVSVAEDYLKKKMGL